MGVATLWHISLLNQIAERTIEEQNVRASPISRCYLRIIQPSSDVIKIVCHNKQSVTSGTGAVGGDRSN